MCCDADLVAACMFLLRLEMHEIRDMVARICYGGCACCVSPVVLHCNDVLQRSHTRVMSFLPAGALHHSLVEVDAVVEQPYAIGLECTIGRRCNSLSNIDVVCHSFLEEAQSLSSLTQAALIVQLDVDVETFVLVTRFTFSCWRFVF